MFGPLLTHILVLLAALGALNWGTIALFNFNIVERLSALVGAPSLAHILYIIIGAAGLLALLHALQEIL
jgi:uncharacterized membrane protein YuzA (DUF378 family)